MDSAQAEFSHDQILPVDMPGCGEFVKESSPTSIAGLFQFVRAQAVQKSSSARFKILAVSLGGMIAMEWMRQRPEELTGCVLINTSSSALSPFYQRMRWQVWPRFLKLLTLNSPRERERAILNLICNSESARAEALPAWAHIAHDRPVSYQNFARQLWAAHNFKGLSEKPAVPVLLLNGLGDRFVEPACSAALHKEFGWPLIRHPWAGHDLPWDDPQWVLSKVKEWNFAINEAH